MSDLGGINPHHAAAGFGGGLAALPFLKPANRLALVGSVIAGVATAMYLTPVAAEILASPKLLASPMTARAELGLAFLLGLAAMVLIPAVLGAVTWVRDNIAKIMERVTGTKPSGGGEQ